MTAKPTKKKRHDSNEDRASLAPVRDVTAEAEHQGERDEQKRYALQQVRQRRGVLQRTCGVHAVVAAPVRAQLLDGDLARLRPYGHDALVDDVDRSRVLRIHDVAFRIDADRLDELHRLIGREVLRGIPAPHRRSRARKTAAGERRESRASHRRRSCRDSARLRPTRPRNSAKRTAMPTAGVTKFCTVRPMAWEK